MFNRNRADRDDRRRILGRCNRTDFWAGLTVIVIAEVALRGRLGSPGTITSIVLGLHLARGRMRDFGRKGLWIVWLPICFIFSYFFVQRIPLALGLDVSLMALTSLIFIVYVGWTPGDNGPNQFGPSPAGLLKTFLAGKKDRRARVP